MRDERAAALALSILVGCASSTSDRHGLVVIAGQSNAAGGADVADITDPWVEFEMSSAYDDVLLAWQIAQSSEVPLVSESRGDEPLAPRPAGPTSRIGVEVSLGRSAHSVAYLYKFAVNGTNLYDSWNPAGSYPTEPVGGPNLFSQLVTHIQSELEETGADLQAIVWIQGNGDANDPDTAAAYGGNLTGLEAALRSELAGDWFFLFDRCRLEFGPYAAEVRAGQEAFARASASAVMINSDDLTLRDPDHYDADAFVILGRRFAVAVERLADPPVTE